jgi:hypothetical protein
MDDANQVYCKDGFFFDLDNSNVCIEECAVSQFDGTHPVYGAYCTDGSSCSDIGRYWHVSGDACVDDCPFDVWKKPSTLTCEGTCDLMKEERTPKSCLVSCEELVDAQNRCYKNLGLSIDSVSDYEDGQVTTIISGDQADVLLSSGSPIVSSIEITSENQPLTVLDPSTYTLTTNPAPENTFTITTSVEKTESFTLTINFDLNSDFRDSINGLYHLTPTSLTTNDIEYQEPEEQPPQSSEPQTFTPVVVEPRFNQPLEPMTEGYIAVMKTYMSSFSITTLLNGIILSTEGANMLTYMAQSFNKLITYTFFGAPLKENLDLIYLSIFRDIFDEVSEWMADQIRPGISKEDIDLVCQKKSLRFCLASVTSNFIVSHLFTIVNFLVILICFGIICLASKKSEKFMKMKGKFLMFTIPNFFASNQLQLIFGIGADLTLPYFGNTVSIIGYAISSILLILLATAAFYWYKHKEGRMIGRILTENFKKIMETKKMAIFYQSLVFNHDIIMTVVIISLQKHPKYQVIVWTIFELIFTIIALKKKIFKQKLFTIRFKAVAVLFSLLSLSMVYSVYRPHQSTPSVLILIISLTIMLIDVLLSFFIFWQEIRSKICVKKRKGKNLKKMKRGLTIKLDRSKWKMNQAKSKKSINRPNPFFQKMRSNREGSLGGRIKRKAKFSKKGKSLRNFSLSKFRSKSRKKIEVFPLKNKFGLGRNTRRGFEN